MTFARKLGITDPSHGTRSRYVLGCRCDECKAANREAARIRDERAREDRLTAIRDTVSQNKDDDLVRVVVEESKR